jgi:UDP-glucose:(glucosyl)LPS alpha-1,2-glucosyltransferase
MILPPREAFSPDAAGAIAIVVHRLSRATPEAVVLGAPVPGGGAFDDVPFIPIGRGKPSQWGYIWGAIRAVRRLAPEAADVHQHPLLARILAALFPRLRVMLIIHNDPLTMRGLTSPRQRRAALRRLHCVVTVSEHLRQRYVQGLTQADGSPVTLVNPVDFDRLPPPCDTRKREFLFVGRVTRDKGVDLFIEACGKILPRLPGWSARIIGGERFGLGQKESEFFRAIRAAATEAGIVCTGYQPQPEVLQAMSGTSIIAMPSRMIEGFPLTAIEAMASGATLIATAQGGLPEAAGEAAQYIPVNDADALAAAMYDLASDDAARATLAKAARERAKNFETSAVAQGWRAVRLARP